jgi:hypothetical protein
MSEQTTLGKELTELLSKNEALVTHYYKLAAFVLLAVLLAHIVFAAFFLIYVPSKDTPQVLQFVAFNATVLFVEIFLARMAFILASRSGQLRDLRFTILLASQAVEPAKLETAARAVMSLRRDASGLKVVDLESLASVLQKK